MSEEKNKPKFAWKSIAFLTLLIIVLPAMSWYYLRLGANQRISDLKDLKNDLGKANFPTSKPINWYALTPDSLKGRIVIVSFTDLKGQLAENQKVTGQKLQDQFGERSDIFFLNYLLNADSTSAMAFYQSMKLKRNKSYFVIPVSKAEQTEMMRNFHFEQKGDFSNAECPYYSYIDADGTVRSFYDVNKREEVVNLVKHIAMKIFDKKENPRTLREIEK
jgi:hypothetical protein